MHFYEVVDATEPKEQAPTPAPSDAVTAQDLQDLKEAFTEKIENTLKANNEAFKKEMLEFFKKENIEPTVNIDKEEIRKDDENGS